MLEPSSFQRLVDFVLAHGDRQTWCNMYNHNPHYAFGPLDVFLNPDVGQRNLDCDPARSGFDVAVIRWEDGGWNYARLTRAGGSVICEPAALPHLPRIFAAIAAAAGG